MKNFRALLLGLLAGVALAAGLAAFATTVTGNSSFYAGWNPATGMNGTLGADVSVGTPPIFTLTGTSCVATSITGGPSAGQFVQTGGTSCTFTLTFPSAAPTGWVCAVTDLTTPADGPAKGASTTTTTWVSGATTQVSGDTFQYNCQGY